MAKRIGRFRRKTRHKLSKPQRMKGMLSLTRFLESYEPGEKVCLKAEPAYQKGMYFPRFHGKAGIVKAKRGRCYEIAIKDQHKEKTLLVHPIHFKRLR